MSSAGGSFGNARLHVGTDWSVHCSAYADALPILTVDAGSSGLAITLADRSVPGERGVEFARELVREAERFAAECERLHTAHPAARPGASGSKTAGNTAA